MGKPKSPRASTGACELAKGLDRPDTSSGMINQLTHTSVTKEVNPHTAPMVVKAHVPTPARHHPYSTRNKAKTKPTQQQAEDLPLNYQLTYLTSEVGGDAWEDPLKPGKLPDVLDDQLYDPTLSTLELYITRGSDADDINITSAQTVNSAIGEALSTICDVSELSPIDQNSIMGEAEVMCPTTSQSSVSPQTTVSQNNDHIKVEMQPQDGQMLTLHFDRNDDSIMKATAKALESGSLTPLIKEELRCTIQSRRLAEGKGEMQVEFRPPPKKKEMTDDERRRALKRRKQNKEAAQRFRQRQKDTSDFLTAKIDRLQAASNSLLKDIDFLRKEKEQLQQMLHGHLQICTRNLPDIEGIDVDQLLSSLQFNRDQSSTPSVTTAAGILSTSCQSHMSCGTDSHYPLASTSSECSVPQSASTCPDTGESTSSVFFSDNDQLVNSHNAPSLLGNNQRHQLMPIMESYSEVHLNGSAMETCSDDQPPFACYEEVVVEIGCSKDFQEEEDRRLDSCSVVDNASICGASYGSRSPSLSESASMGDLRNSLTAAYSKVRLTSSGSDTFDPKLSTEDAFLLTDEEEYQHYL